MPIREQQSTNKQHAIPQSIMSVEFKIIGDLTLKQFFYLLAFCGLAYVSFMTVHAFIIKWLLVLILVGLGICFAFLPLGDRGLDVWVVNFIKAMFLANQYVYRKQEEVPTVFLYQNLDFLKSELITLSPTTSRRKIEAYLEQQTLPTDKLDIDERSYILMVKNAYSSGYGSREPSVPTAATTTTVVEETPQPDLTQLELPAPHPWTTQSAAPTVEQPKTVAPPTPPPPPPPAAPKAEQIIEVSKPVEEPQQIIKSQASFKQYRHPKQPEPQSNYYSPTMTPDMHAGRRFINLAQDAGRGDIILPIRGERVLKTVSEQKFELDEAQKVKQLDDLIRGIRGKEIVQKQLVEAQKLKEEEDARKFRLENETQRARELAAQKLAEEAKKEETKQAEVENVRIAQEKERQEKIRQEEEKRKEEARRKEEERVREQNKREQERLQKLRDQDETLRKQKEELLRQQKEEALTRQKQREQPQAIPLKPSQTEESPTEPNIVWGVVVTNWQGTKVPVPGVVVVIKNQRKEVVRAIKTNGQGKFSITTPLISGLYTVEIDKEKKSGLIFELTSVEAKGEVIPTLEIVGKT